MPNKKSAEKKVRQSEKRRLRNKSYKSAMKTQIKKVLAYIEKKEPIEKVKAEFIKTISILDKIGHKNILHRNNVNRKKSRLYDHFNRYVKLVKEEQEKKEKEEKSEEKS